MIETKQWPREAGKTEKQRIAIYASPQCCKEKNRWLYKGYFNVAWFVRAYADLLFQNYEVLTTEETAHAIRGIPPRDKQCPVDQQLSAAWPHEADPGRFEEMWRVPTDIPESGNLWTIGREFDAQVRLASLVAQREVSRVLMFQDPHDVQTHLPEAYALIRNCTLANVPLNINAGATYWAEHEWDKRSRRATRGKWGTWRTKDKVRRAFRQRLHPKQQQIAFIAHDSEKSKMSKFIDFHRVALKEHSGPGGLELTGTSGTCIDAMKYLADNRPAEDPLELNHAGKRPGAGHGPTGGDVVIADDVIAHWSRDDDALKRLDKSCGPKESFRVEHKAKPLVRDNDLSHVVVFFIDHHHAQPHQADIHVLLRTCIHPSHGVLLLLNPRSAYEWGETLRKGKL